MNTDHQPTTIHRREDTLLTLDGVGHQYLTCDICDEKPGGLCDDGLVRCSYCNLRRVDQLFRGRS